MSDDFTQEMDAIIENGKLRDSRFATLNFSLSVQEELSRSATIQAITTAVRADAEAAMIALTEISPADTQAMQLALVRIHAFVYLRRCLQRVCRDGDNAAAQIRAEDQAEAYERDS